MHRSHFDSFDITSTGSGPPAYVANKWIMDIITLIMGTLWTVTYFLMMQQSFRAKTYSMAIFALVGDFTWEATYAFLSPQACFADQLVFTVWLLIDVGLIYACVKHAHVEWAHAPLVATYIKEIFLVCGIMFQAAHWTFLETAGPALGVFWSAFAMQILLSVGMLAQLVMRGSTRGGTVAIWATRYMGSNCGHAVYFLRHRFWPEAFTYVESPFYGFIFWAHQFLDLAYIVVYFMLNKQVAAEEKARVGAEKKAAVKQGGRG
ncbi:hypothetical protein EDC01DRAFT_647480 [Geopyxis carbonaria]|nr:hypothetical protein EDC01DRAFT_647480 [Geopyxis carbonaria]